MSDFTGFDADAAVKAVTPPRIKWQGTVYEGRILSLPEVLPMAEQFDDMAQQEETPVEMIQGLARKLFQKLEVCDEDGNAFPVDAFIDSAPGGVVLEAVEDFLALQLEASGVSSSRMREATTS